MGKYHARTCKAIKKADKHKLGVQFGALCLEVGLPVQVAAKWVGVSRQGVYGWFVGTHDVAERHHNRVNSIMNAIEAALVRRALPVTGLEETIQIIKKYRG